MRPAIAILFAFVCAATFTDAHAAGWTQFRQITEFNQQPAAGSASEMVYVTLAAGSNPSGCSTSNAFLFALTNERHKRIFSMLLAAKMAGNSVMLYTTGTCHSSTGDALLDGVVIE
ncbi:hypothetical protein [Steroidobacter sp.]|uniref:hypothetical protein n=1 Tax=Steroidobacter sp. TaxID=1978227 RepID=UPI001A496C4A|nr:hypothetical protein [Steroidobacter sp.]MBL8269492.1 hypothetical protein [Steroidobacter sp.]